MIDVKTLQDVPQFISRGRDGTHNSWDDFEATLDHWRDSYGLDLDPEFQRGHVWSHEKQVAYVEYCLRGGEQARELLFNCPDFGGQDNWRRVPKGVVRSPKEIVLVDGKQRLTAVRLFMDDQLPAFGKTIKQYEPLQVYKDGKARYVGVSDPYFKFRMSMIPEYKTLLELYIQLNTGGVVHSEEEIKRITELLGEMRDAEISRRQ